MKTEILQVIFEVVDSLNEQLSTDKQLEKNEESILFGPSSVLDSLGLVNLISEVEEGIEDKFNISITLADERAMSQENSPFYSIRALLDYIEVLIKESTNE
jgi:D-alanine--poly(phosphoribitol) ligase subunit 2